ncbi:helix-turn-helix domain-containing protein [Adhaeribacter soli]|uniref:Helix-turn-helix domain-containing protein n=1 Tax=Adhaeribacter soli TaxID=2607655 RepID=A0A5N1J6B7_9BACT|nr:helix-turn-helix domain-containing protein [Adhaeribacter soli]KAA9340143.1 helix-turn-helix domain-containing protein [Adhaeribacter soli]
MNQKFDLKSFLDQAESFFTNCFYQAALRIQREGQNVQLANPIPTEGEDIITIADVCKLLKISRPTVNDWMKTNKLPYKRIGRRVYFIRQDVLAALQSFNRRAK